MAGGLATWAASETDQALQGDGLDVSGEAMNRMLVGKVLYPLFHRVQGVPSQKRLKEFEVSQWWSPERLRALQLERL